MLNSNHSMMKVQHAEIKVSGIHKGETPAVWELQI